MAVGIKVLLLDNDEPNPNGLRSIRKYEKSMIDISAFEAGISDPTSTSVPGYVIKNNKVYQIIRSYFDLDKNNRIFLAKPSMNSMDVLDE